MASKSFLFPITAVLISSASPERNSSSGNVLSIDGSHITNSGCLKQPRRFLVLPRFTPFFPPVLASTWDNRDVETNPHLIPGILEQLKGGSRVLVGNTWPRRDYVHVTDIAEAPTKTSPPTLAAGRPYLSTLTPARSRCRLRLPTVRPSCAPACTQPWPWGFPHGSRWSPFLLRQFFTLPMRGGFGGNR